MSRVPETIASSYTQDLSQQDILTRPNYRRRRSPIIATIADPLITHVDLQKIVEAGANVIWFKTAFISKEQKIRLLGKLDKATSILTEKHGMIDWPVATCIELKTSIVNTGILKGDLKYVLIKEGATVTLTNDIEKFDQCTKDMIFIDNAYMTSDIKVGMLISIAQDEIILRCKEVVAEDTLKCVAIKGGILIDMCTVCVRGAKRVRPVITKNDLQIVNFALEYQVDMIVINYVRSADAVRRIKQFIGRRAKRPLLITGICTAQGLKNFDEILQESDGMLLPREYLTYELEASDIYKMMRIQKWIAGRCQQVGKSFFVSGGVFKNTLKTGVMNDREISDVTNALLDGVTGFVLKESIEAEYTVNVIRLMNELCCAVEPFTNNLCDFWRILSEIKMPTNAAEASAMSCALLAIQSNSRVIIVPTVSGRTVKTLLWLRPPSIIITVSTKIGSTRLLQTYKCCVPLLYRGAPMKGWHLNQEARINFALEYAVKRGWLRYGDAYVTLQRGAEDSCFSDMVRVWKVAITEKHAVECPP